MTKILVRIMIVGVLLLSGSIASAKGSPDYRAGYNDGCSSSKGHYTRSAYKYRHSGAYHKGWRKGKRVCSKRRTFKRKVHHRPVKKQRTLRCNTETPWIAFQRGWDDGYRAARRGERTEPRGCASYRHGWVNGYRNCHCSEQRRPDSYVSGYYDGCTTRAGEEEIKQEAYYQSSLRYRRGWTQGFSDCRDK